MQRALAGSKTKRAAIILILFFSNLHSTAGRNFLIYEA